MSDLSAEEFLAIRPTVEAIEIEGHGKVYVRGLTASERDDYEQSLIETAPDGRTRVKAHQKNIRASLVARCLVKGMTGDRLLTDKQITDAGNVDGAVVDRVWDVARRLSGMDREVTEELAESFGSARDDGSSSE